MAEQFYVGESIRAKVRVMTVDPVSGAKTPYDLVPSMTIRFRNPDGTVLQSSTLGGVPGVTNAGQGYYYATATAAQEGLHTVEYEVGGGDQGREKLRVSVAPF
jgi:hypothetical protein